MPEKNLQPVTSSNVLRLQSAVVFSDERFSRRRAVLDDKEYRLRAVTDQKPLFVWEQEDDLPTSPRPSTNDILLKDRNDPS